MSSPPHSVDRDGGAQPDNIQIVIFGLGRFGTALGQRLQRPGVRVLGVDFNPLAIDRWQKLGLPAGYGDAADAERVGLLLINDWKLRIQRCIEYRIN